MTFGVPVKFAQTNTISSKDFPNAPGMNWRLSDSARKEIEKIEKWVIR